jgi:hypothetical protein
VPSEGRYPLKRAKEDRRNTHLNGTARRSATTANAHIYAHALIATPKIINRDAEDY